MVTTTGVLEIRNLSIQHIADYYSTIGFASIAKELEAIIFQGDHILRILSEKYSKDQRLVNFISEELLCQINKHLLAGENAIVVAGKKVISEFCETKEVLPNLIDLRMWLMMYLGYDISSSNSVKS